MDSSIKDVMREWTNKHHLPVKYCKDFTSVVQAGGHYGYFATELSSMFDTVHTFEPVAKTFEILLTNAVKANIVANNLGLSNKSHTAKIGKTFPGNAGATALSHTEEGPINLISIDTYFEDKEDTVGLIWLDIEGYEAKALEGAAKIIERDRPVLILENKGLIPGFGGNLKGSIDFKDWVCATFGYKFAERVMRDDVLIPV